VSTDAANRHRGFVAESAVVPTPDALAADTAIAARLRRTWDPFFARFGRLTSVQREAIPRILQGEHVLVCSATASGKTEAACAPLVERLLRQGFRRGNRMILYVSPTRALVNDLHARLFGPMSQLGLRVERRTGDHRSSLKVLPDVLLTTPESFDSMLCRGRTESGHALGAVEAIVLDEIHLLHGSPRGEQLRWLLTRLDRLRTQGAREGWATGGQLQRVALSATVPDAEAVRQAYLDDGFVVSVPGAREIEVVEPDELAKPEQAIPDYLSRIAPRREKVLVFVNSRRRADELAYELRRLLSSGGYTVLAHHGSLARSQRENAEQTVQTRDRVVLVATSTLEIGVDIGDVDLVVLDGPPPDVAALLQRIGRGNRRTGTTRVMACAQTAGERMVLDAMLDAARSGWLGPGSAGLQYAVARQQVASYVFQSPVRTRSRSILADLVTECASSSVADSLLLHLEGIGDLLPDAPGAVRLSEGWLDRCSSGEIHSTIEQPPGQTLIDERTGRALVHGVEYQGGSGILAGGELLEVRGSTTRGLLVRSGKSEHVPDGQWKYRGRGAADTSGQAHALRRFLDIPEGTWPMLRIGSWSVAFHLGGSRACATIELLATAARAEFAVTPWVLAVPALEQGNPAPVWLRVATSSRVKSVLRTQLSRTERALGRPQANTNLPEALRLEELDSWLRLDEAVPAMAVSHWIISHEHSVMDRLQLLLDIAKLPEKVVGPGRRP
jgi:ATP-dependent Lhr-like helicase